MRKPRRHLKRPAPEAAERTNGREPKYPKSDSSANEGDDSMQVVEEDAEMTPPGGGSSSEGDDRMEVVEEEEGQLKLPGKQSGGETLEATGGTPSQASSLASLGPESFMCPICYQTLYRPVVLPSSGFGACESCIASLLRHEWRQGKSGAQDPVLGKRGPVITRLPPVYSQLHSTLDEQFPKLYAERKQQVEATGLEDTVREVRERPIMSARDELVACSTNYRNATIAQLDRDPRNLRNINWFYAKFFEYAITHIGICARSFTEGCFEFMSLRPQVPLREDPVVQFILQNLRLPHAPPRVAPIPQSVGPATRGNFEMPLPHLPAAQPTSSRNWGVLRYLLPALLTLLIFYTFPSSECAMPDQQLRDDPFAYKWIVGGRFLSLRVMKVRSQLDPVGVDVDYESPASFLRTLLWPMERLRFSSEYRAHHRLLIHWYLVTEALSFLYTMLTISFHRIKNDRQRGKSLMRCFQHEICYVVLTLLIVEYANLMYYFLEEVGWISRLFWLLQVPTWLELVYTSWWWKLRIGIKLICRVIEGACLAPDFESFIYRSFALIGTISTHFPNPNVRDYQHTFPVTLLRSVVPRVLSGPVLNHHIWIVCTLLCKRYIWG